MTQQRAIDTRADLLAGAATEFARYGYAAASVNNILANTACTKGAMYFHFASKREMAEAVLETATKVYTRIGRHWVTAGDVRPLDAPRRNGRRRGGGLRQRDCTARRSADQSGTGVPRTPTVDDMGALGCRTRIASR
nr:TetR family transcriptional regulator [Rhodococcus sp. 06-621-2]